MTDCTCNLAFFDFVSQFAHALGGAFAIVASVMLFGHCFMWPAAGVFTLYAAVKEFWYDQNYESACDRGSNARDFGFYMLGVGVGILIVLIRVYTESAHVLQKCCRRKLPANWSLLDCGFCGCCCGYTRLEDTDKADFD